MESRNWGETESIERVREYEGRSLEAKVQCGLELWWARYEGRETDGKKKDWWLDYLGRCRMSQPTAWRRMQVAHEFIKWAGIDKTVWGEENWDNPSFPQVMAGIERAKSFSVNDFQEHLFTKVVTLDGLTEKVKKILPSNGQLLGFRLSDVLTKINERVDKDYASWDIRDKMEAKDTLKVIINHCEANLAHMKELDNTSARELVKKRETPEIILTRVMPQDMELDEAEPVGCMSQA